MSGHSSSGTVLEQVLWPDATLESVTADYDAVTLRVRETSGKIRTICCEGYIGYAMYGFWDEVIIERAEITTEHPAIDRCVALSLIHI